MNKIKIMRLTYNLFIYLISPLLIIHILVRALEDANYISRVSERFGFYKQSLKGEVIWIHAVSFGEVKAATPLVRELLKENPSKEVLFTCTTPTGSQLISDTFNDEVINAYLPYDLKGSVKRFFNWANPKIAIIVETEIWPNIFQECGQRKVPLILASACISDRSQSLYKILFNLFKDTISQGIVVGAQTQADANKFLELGAHKDRTFVTGNLKFDISPPDEILDKAQVFRDKNFKNRPVWIAGSTHPGEEQVILRAHKKLMKDFPDSLLIIAPRKPERFNSVHKKIIDSGHACIKWSDFENLEDNTEVLLVDTLGDLPFFYSASDIAFVGGSLFSVGGHNLLEPASFGTPVITGPSLQNVKEISTELIEVGGLEVVKDDQELSIQLNELFANNSKKDQMVSAADKVMHDNKGSIENIMKLIKPFI